MRSLRHALIIESEIMKERQRCLRAIDKLKDLYEDLYEEKLYEERKHIALMALNRAKDYIDS